MSEFTFWSTFLIFLFWILFGVIFLLWVLFWVLFSQIVLYFTLSSTFLSDFSFLYFFETFHHSEPIYGIVYLTLSKYFLNPCYKLRAWLPDVQEDQPGSKYCFTRGDMKVECQGDMVSFSYKVTWWVLVTWWHYDIGSWWELVTWRHHD